MAIGLSMFPLLHSVSQGWGQTRPHMAGKGISLLINLSPSAYFPWEMAAINPGMLIWAGQDALQGPLAHGSKASGSTNPSLMAISRSTSTTLLNTTSWGQTKAQVSQWEQNHMASDPRSCSLSPIFIMWMILLGSKADSARLTGHTPVHVPQSKQRLATSPPGISVTSNLNPCFKSFLVTVKGYSCMSSVYLQVIKSLSRFYPTRLGRSPKKKFLSSQC